MYQLLYRLRPKRIKLRLPKSSLIGYFLTLSKADKPISCCGKTFIFLNQVVTFPENIDWNYGGNGRLWTYNLAYFDFLNQPELTQSEGLYLIRDFITQTDRIQDGLEPYPTSLRILNWIQFISEHKLHDEVINRHLFAQINGLSKRLEYHLAGNHLLENGFALLIGALFFRHEHWYRKAANLIRSELAIQILADGAHYERSPMYHQLLLDRLLNVLMALQQDNWHNNEQLVHFLRHTARRMLSWLNAVTFRNGDLPLLNDATVGIAPTTAALKSKAERVLLTLSEEANTSNANKLSDSGYRLFRSSSTASFNYELFVDAGPIGPNHQPGHAHADTFSFVLHVDNQPVIVDSGTSTYEPGLRRAWERSTAAHNTVEVAGVDSSEVWASFRVGRRARVTVLDDTDTVLTARHDGYRRFGIIHERTWAPGKTLIRLFDRLICLPNQATCDIRGTARFYFHSCQSIELTGQKATAGPVQLSFNSESPVDLSITQCNVANGFNQLQSAYCLSVAFTDRLETTLSRTECVYST
jgi:hypothetical protein